MSRHAEQKMLYQIQMSPGWELQEPAVYAPLARTQLFDIQEPVEQVLQKLLGFQSADSWGIDLFIIERPKPQKVTWEAHHKEVYKEIRQIVASQLAVEVSSALSYDVLPHYGSYLVIYLTSNPDFESIKYKLHAIKRFHHHQIAQTVLSLRIKLLLLADVAQYAELGHVDYNSELYFGAVVQPVRASSKNKDEYYIDALQYELYYSPDFQDLTFQLRGHCFRAKNAGLGVVGDEGRLLIANQATARVTQKVDARIFGDMPYMRFANKEYAGCRNHAENRLQAFICKILSDSAITFTERTYQATHAQLQFISSQDATVQRPLVLIDNLGELECEQNRQHFLQALQEEMGATKVIKPIAIEALTDQCNYLVVNASQKRNGSSVTVQGLNKDGEAEQKELNTYWQALNHARQGHLQDLDYYSQLKISRALALEQHYSKILQGVNVELKKVRHFQPNAKPMIAAQIAMLGYELRLKEAVFADGRMDGFQVPDGEFILVAVRFSKNTPPKKGKAAYIAVTHIAFKSGLLTINPPAIYQDEQRFRYEVPGMQNHCVPKLRDGDFYLIDVQQQVLVSRYETIRVPQIIGSAERSSLQEAQVNAGKIKKTGHPQRTCLPYYLTPKPKTHASNRYQQLFIQKNGHEALLFCAPSNQLGQAPSKRVRTYNLVAKDFTGSAVDALSQPVTELLLRTYTLDLLRYKEVTQSSLLEKIARMMLEN